MTTEDKVRALAEQIVNNKLFALRRDDNIWLIEAICTAFTDFAAEQQRVGAERMRAVSLSAKMPLTHLDFPNSKFWEGYDTGVADYRHAIRAIAVKTGLPTSEGGRLQ